MIGKSHPGENKMGIKNCGVQKVEAIKKSDGKRPANKVKSGNDLRCK